MASGPCQDRGGLRGGLSCAKAAFEAAGTWWNQLIGMSGLFPQRGDEGGAWRRADRVAAVVLFLLAFIFTLIYSKSISPLVREPASLDSGMFQTIGKYWFEQGVIPYQGLWDSKGPAIFFINGAGYWLLHSRLGVFFLAVLALGLAVCFCYRFLRLEFPPRAALLLAALSLAGLSHCEIDNNVELYALPFLMPAFMHVFVWADGYRRNGTFGRHPWKWAVLYGVTVAFCLLTRLTNAVGLCVAMGFIAVALVAKGAWRNLGANVLGFACGFLLLYLPFAAYFQYHGALADMWYAMFWYNLDYAASSGVAEWTWLRAGSYATAYTYSLLAVAVSAAALVLRRRNGWDAVL